MIPILLLVFHLRRKKGKMFNNSEIVLLGKNFILLTVIPKGKSLNLAFSWINFMIHRKVGEKLPHLTILKL